MVAERGGGGGGRGRRACAQLGSPSACAAAGRCSRASRLAPDGAGSEVLLLLLGRALGALRRAARRTQHHEHVRLCLDPSTTAGRSRAACRAPRPPPPPPLTSSSASCLPLSAASSDPSLFIMCCRWCQRSAVSFSAAATAAGSGGAGAGGGGRAEAPRHGPLPALGTQHALAPTHPCARSSLGLAAPASRCRHAG